MQDFCLIKKMFDKRACLMKQLFLPLALIAKVYGVKVTPSAHQKI